MFSNAVKLFSISGFDIKVDPSWLIIVGLMVWSLSQHYFPTTLPGATGGVYLAMALIATILFFACLLLHELAHAVVARRFGLPVGDITLFLFGGVAEIESEPRAPRVDFLVAAAGPAMSLALSLSFVIATWVVSTISQLAAVMQILTYLAVINLILALFNLAPAFPLDGGRMLRAVLWHRSGNMLRATEIAAKAGILFAFVLMALGVVSLFQGAMVPGLWQIVIGGFLLMAARESGQSQQIPPEFDKRCVGDLMQPRPITVSPDVSLAGFVNRTVLRHGLSFVPVVDEGVLLGHINHAMLLGIDRENWSNTQVGDVFAGLDSVSTVEPDMPVDELLKVIATTGRRKFLVVEDGMLVGVVSLSDLTRHLRLSELMPAA